MKIKNTKYILVLLAGIISLVSGCGCGKGGEGKGSSVEVATLEAIEKKFLDELKTLYLEDDKAVQGVFYDKAKSTKEFERLYTDTETDSFVTKWRLAKGAADKGDMKAISTIATSTANKVGEIKNRIDVTGIGAKEKAFREKALELHTNRLKMIEAYLGIETKEDKK